MRLRLPTRNRKQETPSNAVRAIVGLRNPGPDYEGTRHNIGYEVVSALLERHGATLGRAPSRLRSLLATIGTGEGRALIVVPATFMNDSGQAVRSSLEYHKVPTTSMIVVHDDIDLAFGRFRLQVGGGSGGRDRKSVV